MYDIVVIGAGVVGLSTAVNIQDLNPTRRITIIADKFTTDTTSNGAAGIFRPTLEKTSVKSIEKYRKWCQNSFDWFHKLNTEIDPAQTGVIKLTGYHFSETKQYPLYHDIVYDFRELNEHELHKLPGNHSYGWMFSTLMTECRRYLPWLTNMFLSKGGNIEQRKITSINEFAGKCSLIVNCSGLGSEELFNDKEMFPVRGHLVRVNAPWIKHFYVWNDSNSYIYPGQYNVVLGGTRHKGEYDCSMTGSWFDDIVASCDSLLPGIKNCDIVSKWVGLRPHRTVVRLEQETRHVDGFITQIVHNYGHGANGIGLSWGTAIEAAQIAKHILESDDRSMSKL